MPFVFTINYNPAVAQISFKGRAHVTGEREEFKQIHNARMEKKPPPPIVVQSIFNIAFFESILITRTLNIPPACSFTSDSPRTSRGKETWRTIVQDLK